MHESSLPSLTLLPFVVLVLGIAILPNAFGELWAKRRTQLGFVALVSLPLVAYLVAAGRAAALAHATSSYATFICTIGALFVAAGGVHATGDLRATPRTNAAFLVVGALLASVIGTTGASVLVLRPLLRTNGQREHKAHLVPFFILVVANVGGLLTPLGDPPLLVGFVQGVPFFWTLRLLPVWLLYVTTLVGAFVVVDARAYARETTADLARDERERAPLVVEGKRNLLLLAAIVGAAFLPPVVREVALVLVALGSWLGTPRGVHEKNGFHLEPIVEVATIFAGIFACLVPVEELLTAAAPGLPLRASWQLFWASGSLSAVLDNAPTYAAFAALARGLAAGKAGLVAGMTPAALAAISAGSVVMGATTYVGNGPNLIVKAIAERAGVAMPSFARYALFAFATMLPAHLVVTAALVAIER